ncbi:MAG: VanW family protein [Clostridiales bacterium]|nr:VanW family protein [Clostridiales bacterium]MDY5515440.1 VanW family protein [Candidatus Ventricola sp.]
MAFDRRNGRRAKEERSLFPLWTLVVIVLCVGLWVYGAKLYQDLVAAYRTYAAISQAAAQTTFFPGVTVDGIDLGGMTRGEAQALFTDRQAQTTEAFSLIVASGERRWRITSQEVPVTFNADAVLEQAYAIGRSGTLLERYQEIERARTQGVSLTTGYVYDRSAVRDLVEIVGDSLDVAATDARLSAFDVSNRTFTFEAESAGYRIDRDKLESDILAALDAHAYDSVIVPQGERVEPQVTLSQLQGLFGRISSFTTTTTRDSDRNTNIALSASALNGRVVQPGETLSFNACTGQRTGEKGYREAGAIAGGVLVDDTGGGVCQTSSTLFNAVVRADLQIVERYAHSWPSSYVNKGEDATVNWPSLDFVFKNNGDFPVFVVAWYEAQQVTVEIYGHMLENGMTIDLESTVTQTIKPSDEVLYTLDESLPVGTRKAGRSKRTGYVVDTYKVYKDSEGNEIRREKLWTTTYRAQQDEILYH